ncbi:MAG TPA: hypothetical protein PKI03_09035 [Pseudomonadota bacterium]|nr:hypothetical protein [Pseudomonadota bacterium]
MRWAQWALRLGLGGGGWALLFGSGVQAKTSVDLSAEEYAERDALIGKIARGEDYEASIARFRELWQKREALRADEVAEQKRAEEAHKRQQADSKSVDGIVGSHCALYRDPKNPPGGQRENMSAEWGKVVRKELVRLPPKNAFDDGEQITLYRIEAQRATYTVSSQGPTYLLDRPLTAQVGDLVLLCIMSRHSEGSGSKFPPDFRENILSQGFAVRIKEPPLIVKKSQNPLPLLGEWRFRAAIDRVEWTAPPEQPVLNRLFVLEALPPENGRQRFAIAAERHTYVLEVPPTVRNRELLRPGEHAWVIMGQARFDRAQRKLVLVAEDVEARYVTTVAGEETAGRR